MVFGTSLAILTSVFSADERGKALGINVAAVYSGLSLGSFLGGLLTQHLTDLPPPLIPTNPDKF